MKNNDEKIVNQYIKEIRMYLPIYQKKEKRFLTDLKSSLLDFSTTTGQSDINTLINAFGEPRELALNYIREQDAENLRSAIAKNIYIKRAIIIIILITLGFSLTRSVMYYTTCKRAADAYIHREIITIEEE